MSDVKTRLADLRRNYAREELTEQSVHADPFKQFEAWFTEALASEILEPNAMTLATAGSDGRPAARIVLLKGLDDKGFVFFTNYDSRKGRHMKENPYAALNFLWLELERQVCIEGEIEKVSREETEAYFASRPRGSQIGAWTSPQSQPVTREELDLRLSELQKKYESADTIPAPEHWGGYRLLPHRIEFWQGRPSRLHDRIVYRKEGNNWRIQRLAP